jgi:flagellar basal body rod protein FlgC
MATSFDIGIAGLRAAETRVAARAQIIANWQSKDYRPAVPMQTSADGGPIVRVTRPPELSGEFPFVDLTVELVDMQLAKRAYQASAKVVKTAGEMSKTLLDALA